MGDEFAYEDSTPQEEEISPYAPLAAIAEQNQLKLAKLESKPNPTAADQANLSHARQVAENLQNLTAEDHRRGQNDKIKKVATIAGGVGVGLAALLAGGYALYNHFSGSGNMDPPGEAEPEDPAADNVFMSPEVRENIDRKLGVKKRPGKAQRKPSARRRKRG